MTLNKTLPGLAFLRIKSSTLDPKSPSTHPKHSSLQPALSSQPQREIFLFLCSATV